MRILAYDTWYHERPCPVRQKVLDLAVALSGSRKLRPVRLKNNIFLCVLCDSVVRE
jgi:hypothetical protein